LARTGRMGDPMSTDTQVGPITTRPQYDKVLGYIDIAKKEGAKLLLGGEPATRPECGNGWFVEPTIFSEVFSEVNNKMRIAQEEVFGPVLSIIKFKDEDEAVEIANDSRFGLGAGVWTSDIGRTIRMSERIESGTVWINCWLLRDLRVPFGGMKESGVGREGGVDSLEFFTEAKNVCVKL